MNDHNYFESREQRTSAPCSVFRVPCSDTRHPADASTLQRFHATEHGTQTRASLRPSTLDPHRHPPAFTLIELLVVIAVIAILATLIFPVTGAVYAARTKARAKAELAEIETAIERYKDKRGHYPPDNPGNPVLNQLYYELL